MLAGAVDLLAGITIEKRLESFLTFPALFVLVPAFLEDSGSLGAILAARISTKLHLGTLGPAGAPWRAAIDDVMLIYMYAIPVFVFLGTSSIIVAHVAEQGEPGGARHDGRDPARRVHGHDRLGGRGLLRGRRDLPVRSRPRQPRVPMVTSSLDLLGALSLILAIVILGLG